MARLTLRSNALPDGLVQYGDHDMPITIGRSRRADLVINDQQLSRRHSQLRYNLSGRFEIVDLDSTNLTIVNSHDVDLAELKTGDLILLGETELTVEVEYPEGDINEKTTRELPAMPRPRDT